MGTVEIPEGFDTGNFWLDRWERKPDHPGSKLSTQEAIQKQLPILFDERKLRYEGKKILDVGCGTGEMLRWFRDECGMDVFGLEIGKAPVNALMEEGFQVSLGDLRVLFPERKHDFVFASFVVQHMVTKTDFEMFYVFLHQAVKIRGYIILVDLFKGGPFRDNLLYRTEDQHAEMWWRHCLEKKYCILLDPERDKGVKETACKRIMLLQKKSGKVRL